MFIDMSKLSMSLQLIMLFIISLMNY